MPDSCANALAPTIALLGWIANPVRYDTRRDAAVICSVWTAAASVRELPRTSPEGHHDLLQARVAGPFAEAVDRDLHLPGTRLDGSQRVGRREAQVVVAVDADGRLVPHPLPDAPDQRAELGRSCVAHGVRDVHGGGAGLDHGLVDVQQVVHLGPRRVLGRELDLRVAAHRLPRPGDPAAGPRRGPRRGTSAACCLRWMSLVAMNRWRCGRSASTIASRPSGRRHGSARGPPQAIPPLASPGRSAGPPRSPRAQADGKPASITSTEARQLAGTSRLLPGGQAGTRRLLAAPKRGVEDAHGAGGHAPRTGDGSPQKVIVRPPGPAWRWPRPGPGRPRRAPPAAEQPPCARRSAPPPRAGGSGAR